MLHLYKHAIWRILVRLKENQDASYEGKEWKGMDKNTTTIAHQYKDPTNQWQEFLVWNEYAKSFDEIKQNISPPLVIPFPNL